MIISPTEPEELQRIGRRVSWTPETYGVDVLMYVKGRRIGVQRKAFKDLLGSLEDGRLMREVMQMRAGLDQGVLIVEGKGKYDLEGRVVDKYWGKRFTKAQIIGVLLSVQAKGCWVMHTDGLRETVEVVQWIEKWFRKEKHSSLESRVKPKSVWGLEPSNEEFAAWVLQSLPGVGVETARRIVEKYGMCVGWRVSKEDLMQVEGVGKVKAERMWNALGGGSIG